MARKQTTVEKPGYSITLRMNGVEFKASGASLLEAMSGLGVDYTKVKTKGEVIVSKGDKNYTRIIQLPKLRRYFASKILMGGFIRDFEKLLA